MLDLLIASILAKLIPQKVRHLRRYAETIGGGGGCFASDAHRLLVLLLDILASAD